MSYGHLRLDERSAIHMLTSLGLSNREIGLRLGRHHTTIGREKRRNGLQYPSLSIYNVRLATRRIEERRSAIQRHRRRADHRPLWRYVMRGLQRRWSPEQIAGRIRLDHPDDLRMRIAPETVYRWIYRDAAVGGDLYRQLRRARRKRHHQRRTGSGRGCIPGRVGIEQRPEIVVGRRRFGDWESDTMEGAKGRGLIATHVERKSRYLLTVALQDKKADRFATRTVQAFRTIPRAWRCTMTADNGKEFARFKRIEEKTGLTVYFADPYSAWQRGTNENTNGLLRQYFPKGCDFTAVSEKDLAYATRDINHRPRKCLDYRTPHEVFSDAKRGALAT